MEKLKPFVSERPCELLFNLMTSFLTRFVDREDLAPSYQALYGRPGVLERIRALPKGTGEREEAAVEEYCKSLRDVCGFLHISRAVVMDAKKERVRYYMIFATNSLHGIEVFKDAEAAAAETQDEVRHQTQSKNEGPFLPFGTLKSRKVADLHQRYVRRLRKNIVKVLSSGKSVVAYDDLYSEAMEFPLVTPNDLEELLRALEPNIQIQREGPRRKKLLLFNNDRILVLNSKALK